MNAPKPGPRPGAKFSRTPVPATKVTAPANPQQFGRIAEDGTVYVTHRGQERAIASWQAGTPEEGLAHFAQRFEDLATEVALLESRLQSHPEDAARIKASAQDELTKLDTATVIGDLDDLESRLKKIIDSADTIGQQTKEAQLAAQKEALAKKQALVAEAEELAENSTDWKEAGDRIREILDEWKNIRVFDRNADDALWKQYAKARDAFNRRRGAYFAELDRKRADARSRKEELIAEAEALQDSTEWHETTAKYRELTKEWKKAGRAPREVENALWERFRAAQDHFFDARTAMNEARDAEFEANARAKEDLLNLYDDEISPSLDLDTARVKLRELQEKWEEIGFVPRQQIKAFEQRLRSLEQRVSDAAAAQWRKTDPNAQARAEQFAAKVKEFEKQAEDAAQKGNEAAAQKFREQAKQWQEFADAAVEAIKDR
ncbi:MAG: DUF349 domain-containing protein [Corynebacterium sp.]|nr:DUF349 domain-containing protein [Corynebacterium sp.]